VGDILIETDRAYGVLGATLGATRMYNLLVFRTRMDNQQRRASGHALFTGVNEALKHCLGT
jgi:hypothetical protein